MRFEKVSYEKYREYNNFDCREEYDNIKIPARATKHSAGYDFYSPFEFILHPNETMIVATGIRIKLDDDKFLLITPRSSLGFQYRMQIDNTVAVIDSDYYNAPNEGHIFIKVTNDSKDGKILKIKQGEAFCQGIILKYLTIENDETTQERVGGLGSTNKEG